MFGALRAAGMLRVDEDTEKSGNDIPKHGEAAYPADAWVEMQYKKNVKEARRNSTLPPHMVSEHELADCGQDHLLNRVHSVMNSLLFQRGDP